MNYAIIEHAQTTYTRISTTRHKHVRKRDENVLTAPWGGHFNIVACLFSFFFRSSGVFEDEIDSERKPFGASGVHIRFSSASATNRPID